MSADGYALVGAQQNAAKRNSLMQMAHGEGRSKVHDLDVAETPSFLTQRLNPPIGAIQMGWVQFQMRPADSHHDPALAPLGFLLVDLINPDIGGAGFQNCTNCFQLTHEFLGSVM